MKFIIITILLIGVSAPIYGAQTGLSWWDYIEFESTWSPPTQLDPEQLATLVEDPTWLEICFVESSNDENRWYSGLRHMRQCDLPWSESLAPYVLWPIEQEELAWDLWDRIRNTVPYGSGSIWRLNIADRYKISSPRIPIGNTRAISESIAPENDPPNVYPPGIWREVNYYQEKFWSNAECPNAFCDSNFAWTGGPIHHSYWIDFFNDSDLTHRIGISWTNLKGAWRVLLHMASKTGNTLWVRDGVVTTNRIATDLTRSDPSLIFEEPPEIDATLEGWADVAHYQLSFKSLEDITLPPLTIYLFDGTGTHIGQIHISWEGLYAMFNAHLRVLTSDEYVLYFADSNSNLNVLDSAWNPVGLDSSEICSGPLDANEDGIIGGPDFASFAGCFSEGKVE